MLTVNINQHFPELLEFVQGHRAAIDISPGTALGGHHTPQYAFIVAQVVLFTQPLPGLFIVTDIKAGADIGFVLSGLDDILVGTVTQGERQRIQHDGFAGAGFPGDNGHARLQFEVKLLDNGVVIYGELV